MQSYEDMPIQDMNHAYLPSSNWNTVLIYGTVFGQIHWAKQVNGCVLSSMARKRKRREKGSECMSRWQGRVPGGYEQCYTLGSRYLIMAC